MRAAAIMYHDVVEDGNEEASGFPGAGANIYKLSRQEFSRHLEAIHAAVGTGEVCLTFDDGGASAYDPVAGMLERYGWRGSFFITTDWVGRPGFLSPEQIRELDRRGHVIGSHSCSHPTRMSQISWEQMLQEWRGSIEWLAGVLGHPVKTASVPGGYYSRRVAEAAAAAGIELLFTSEPTARIETVKGCRVVGRYALKKGMGPEWAAGLATRKWILRLRQSAVWKLKLAAKALGGEIYLRARESILKRTV